MKNVRYFAFGLIALYIAMALQPTLRTNLAFAIVTPTATATHTATATPTFTAATPTPTATATPTPTSTPTPNGVTLATGRYVGSAFHAPVAVPTAANECLLSGAPDALSGIPGPAVWASCLGGGAPINAHTLTGATPVAVVTSATVPTVDVENMVLSINVTTFTLPAAAAVADGEILHVKIRQSASGGPYTLPSATVGPFTAGSGTIVSALSTATCPTIGTTQSATVPSEFWADIIYYAPLTEWVVTSCGGVR